MSAVSIASDGSHVLRYDRLKVGDYYADFRRDNRLVPEVYHCIIQREGSNEILSWSQYRSLDAARQSAEAEINRLSSSKSK
jgi:hypothetical protein